MQEHQPSDKWLGYDFSEGYTSLERDVDTISPPQPGPVKRWLEQRREELKEEEFEAGAGNDRVMAKANGGAELVSVTIDPELLSGEGIEMTQDLVVAACNAALEKARVHVENGRAHV